MPNTFNMAFCDGSVQQVNYMIDGKVHANFGNHNDGNIIGANKL